MKRSLKILTAITLSLLLVFGSSLGAFANAKNTSINLHADATGYTVFVVLQGDFSSNGVYDSDKTVTTVPLLGGSLYKSTDFSIDVQPFVRYFIIDGVIWNIPENIKEGKEGKGTINYWMTKMPTKNVYYHKNNEFATGTEPVDSYNYFFGETVEVMSKGDLALVGHTFDGWNTESGGTGTSYNAGDAIEMQGSDVHLYAKWIPELPPPPTPFYVFYHANNDAVINGDVPEDLNSYHEGNSVTVLGNTGNLEVDGYTFEGWNTLENGLGLAYSEDETFNMPANDVHLYAVWKMIPTYSLTYNGNGATSGNAPAPQTFYPTGTEVTVLGNSGGYDILDMYFEGWNTDASGEGVFYAPGQKLTIGTTDIVLYAQWSRYIPINGTITIQKIITGVEPITDEIFEFRIIKFDGEGSYVYNELPIYIEGAGSYVEYNVPVGIYHVEEINIPDDYTLMSENPQNAWIGLELGYNPIVRFENQYTEPLGSITVNKALVGDTPPSNGTFSFRLVGPAGEGSTTRELSRTGIGSVTFTGLSYGTYTLTEFALPTNYSIESGNNVQLSIQNQTPTVTATITNRYTQPTPPTPPPPPPTPDRGTVRVHYVDLDENLLDPIFEFSGTVGTNYTTAAREYEELELVEIPVNATGTFIDGIIDVFYVYSPGVEPLVILEVEEETPLGPPVIPEEEIVITEPIPLAPLPQTGQLPAELFYGLGSMIGMIGVALRKGRK